MNANSGLSVSYLSKNGDKLIFNSEEIHIELKNGQILTISSRKDGDGVIISDQSCATSHEHFAILSIKPGACNLVEISSEKKTRRTLK